MPTSHHQVIVEPGANGSPTGLREAKVGWRKLDGDDVRGQVARDDRARRVECTDDHVGIADGVRQGCAQHSVLADDRHAIAVRPAAWHWAR